METKALVEVKPNGKIEVLLQTDPDVFVSPASYVKWRQGKEKSVEEVKKIGKKEKVKAFLKTIVEKKKASKEAKTKKTAYPLVSKEQYKKHLELLRLSFTNSQKDLNKQKKPKVSDRALYKELEDAFVRDSWPSYGSRKDTAAAFLNGLADIYKKNKGKIDWIDWFNASKTGQNSGADYIQTDNYEFGALGKYFNIYPSEKGTLESWPPKTYGYFFGFA